jgi:hypothetical protein
VRLSDRLAVVPNESDVDFRHFRLTATRNYGLPPEKCVDVEPDGVSLSIDLARSDLLLDTEPPELKRLLVLAMPTPELADGLRQWPGTRSLIQGQLGPTALVVQEEHLPLLQERLHALGMTVRREGDG